MSKAVNTQRWFAAWRGASRPVQQDPADLGTAFGLDMSMMDAQHEEPPAAAERRAGWMQRLGWRRKPLV
jgi:hypothetical protein